MEGAVTGRRVAFATTGLNLGGAETQLCRLALALQERGWEVRVLSLLPAGHFEPVLQQAGIEVRSLEMRRGRAEPGALRRGVGILREWSPPILSCFAYHANLFGRLAGPFAGVPAVVSSVRNEHFGGSRRDLILRFTDRLGTVTVANCHAVADALIRRRVVPEDRMRVIPNSLAVSAEPGSPRERAETRRALGFGPEDFVWLAVGRLEAQKDYPTLLEAFSKVAKATPRSRLMVAGRGDPTSFERVAGPLVGTGSCRFLGVRTDVAALLRSADGFVLSSAWEGLPNGVMEALAASLPVVATRVGGIPELVLENRTGLLVPPRDPSALASAMLRMQALPVQHRAQLGAAGRRLVEAEYSLPRVVDRWEALYGELLTRAG